MSNREVPFEVALGFFRDAMSVAVTMTPKDEYSEFVGTYYSFSLEGIGGFYHLKPMNNEPFPTLSFDPTQKAVVVGTFVRLTDTKGAKVVLQPMYLRNLIP